MQIAIIENNQVVSVGDYRTLFPQTSFGPNGPSDGWMEENNCKKVNLFLAHDRATEKLVSCAPYIDGEWVYTVAVEPLSQEELDANAQQEQLRINQQSRDYLASTDWYVVRFAETGTAIPQDILDARVAARASIIEPVPTPVV